MALESAVIGGLGDAHSAFSAATADGPDAFSAAASFPGTLYAWGANGSGQLGVGDASIHYSPVKMSSQWLRVAGGQDHSCGIQQDATLWCWGANSVGQLGLGAADGLSHNSPVAVSGGGTYSVIDVGYDDTCAIQTDGTLWCWGGNGSGQLGTGDSNEQDAPAQIGSASWTTVASGQYHTCGIQTDGTLWCWGANGDYQLGTGDTSPQLAPWQIGTATNWKSVGAGNFSTCATKTDGTLWCWGDNSHGQIGNGTTTQQPTPTQVGAATNWSTVAVGEFHACANRTDGSLWCWGENSNGQLGIGSTQTPQLSPVQVSAGEIWTSVIAGFNHTCGMRSDATAWCWGDNTNGQMGTGDTAQHTSPVKIPFTSVRLISSGSMSNATFAISREVGPQVTLSATTWYEIVSARSGMCIEAQGSGTTDGTVVQQSTCASPAQANQAWQFVPTDSGYYRVLNRNASAQNEVWDVIGGVPNDGTLIQTWQYGGGTNEQWAPLSLSSTVYSFEVRGSASCLDDTNGSTTAGTQYQVWGCSAGINQQFTLTAVP